MKRPPGRGGERAVSRTRDGEMVAEQQGRAQRRGKLLRGKLRWAGARAAIFDHVEGWYDTDRQLTLDDDSLIDYESGH